MPLSQDTLRDNVLRALNKTLDELREVPPGTPPNIPSSVARNLASAYDDYVSSGVPAAGALSIVVPGQVDLLSSALVAPMFAGWAPGLVSYWAPVIWAGPGFIPVNPTVPAALAGIAPEMAQFVLEKRSSREEAAGAISEILHRYTTQVTVTATTVPPASVVSVIPIV